MALLELVPGVSRRGNARYHWDGSDPRRIVGAEPSRTLPRMRDDLRGVPEGLNTFEAASFRERAVRVRLRDLGPGVHPVSDIVGMLVERFGTTRNAAYKIVRRMTDLERTPDGGVRVT